MAMEMIKGLATTLSELGRSPRPSRIQRRSASCPPRFRGRHVLHRYENGLERCVGCFLCAGACPADAIYIEAEENTEENRVSPGERYARVFDVNLLRCIFCGYCEQACPTGAITLENIYELASTHPEDLVYHKEQLLEPAGSATRGSLDAWSAPAPEETRDAAARSPGLLRRPAGLGGGRRPGRPARRAGDRRWATSRWAATWRGGGSVDGMLFSQISFYVLAVVALGLGAGRHALPQRRLLACSA